jgi:hypothetical protein
MKYERDGKVRGAFGPCVALALLVGVSGCATTEITSSWKAPDAEPLERGQKVIAVVVAPNQKQRNAAEDELARHLKDGTAAHRVFNEAELRDQAALRERLSKEGFKYGVVMTLVEAKTELQPVIQPTDSHNMWGQDESLVWQDVEEPNTTVRVVTRVYSVADGKLIWHAESTTMNPTEVDELVDDIAKAAAERLEKDGMVASK